MEHLQIKNLFLRLSLEQATNIILALEEGRQNIADESLAFYDSLVDDIHAQFVQQGVRIDT